MRVAILAFVSILFAFPAASDPLIPERRAVVSQDKDFFGRDLAQIFDTTAEACFQACRADTSCAGFTYNSRSSACFPKSEIEDELPYVGALSARLVPATRAALTQAEAARDAASFLGAADWRAAFDLALNLPISRGFDTSDPEELIQTARALFGSAPDQAYRLTASAVAQTDLWDQWEDLARLAGKTALKGSDKRKRQALAVPAAINAYLRAGNARAQASASYVLAQALERQGRGRAALSAARLSFERAARTETTLLVNRLRATYGFRVVDTQVDSEAAAPRLCAILSEALNPAVDYASFVQLPQRQLALQAEDRQLCVTGVTHGERYRLVLRAGLPSRTGERLMKDVELTLYVRDRAPSVRFPGRAYVLPRSAQPALPVVTVNAPTVLLELSRISERNLTRAFADRLFGRPLSAWQEGQFNASIATPIWTGEAEVAADLNQDVTTRLPLEDALRDQPAGLYALRATVPGQDIYDSPAALQWFVLSNIGISMVQGADGVHATLRKLDDLGALEGATVELVSQGNTVLGRAESGADGRVSFDAALARGTGAEAPAVVTVTHGADFAFLSLTEAAFDLSDRGVAGRPAGGPVDVFLALDRGAYRAGETVHLTALARDARARALTGLPLTLIVERPDGVEFLRQTSSHDLAGGHVFSVPLGASVPRGTWRAKIVTDPAQPALVSEAFLVEDFLPERLDMSLTLPESSLGASAPLGVEAAYLFGAPAANLALDGDVVVRAAPSREGYEGYQFGRHDARVDPRSTSLPSAQTDPSGRAKIAVALAQIDGKGKPLEAEITVRLRDGAGRPLERSITRPVETSAPMVGLRPAFDGVLGEGAIAEVSLVSLDATGAPQSEVLTWALNRIETRYQWYQLYGNWNWDPVTRRTRISAGEIAVNGPTPLSFPVDWGQYELAVTHPSGAESAILFDAGWYATGDSAATPDRLEMSLDKTQYKPQESARLRVVTLAEGIVILRVLSDRLISETTHSVGRGATTLTLPVTEDWGAGAYVTATFLRAEGDTASRAPVRAIGVAHALVEPKDALLAVTLDTPQSHRPDDKLVVRATVDSQAGDTFVTFAAVDQGILNLTGYEPPDPKGHYFDQRRLGASLRDFYGRLIDGRTGALGRVRSGGDSLAQLEAQASPPEGDLAAFFSGPLRVGPDGTVEATFDTRGFDGTLRVMAVAWSEQAVGQADAEVLVRDPLVIATSLPRFMAPGDVSRVRIEMTDVSGLAAPVALRVSAEGAVLGEAPVSIDFSTGQQQVLELPIRADAIGLVRVRVEATLPDGRIVARDRAFEVKRNDPLVQRINRVSLEPGATLTFDTGVLEGLYADQAEATLAVGSLAQLNVAGLIQQLDRYPYGCTEQVASATFPLLYFDTISAKLGLSNGSDVSLRIAESIEKILARQDSTGSFGLWSAQGGDLWLDAYVSDFLTRARSLGHVVQDRAFEAALDNLRNRVNYAPEFEKGGEGLAYALLVLARNQKAATGDLRYYADVKGAAFSTPLAQAQLATALASYGDQTRADTMFTRAGLELSRRVEKAAWRDDFGTPLRDTAGVLALVAEARSGAVPVAPLVARLQSTTGVRTTQEAAWTLLAAQALGDVQEGQVALNGAPLASLQAAVLTGPTAQPQTVRNTGTAAVDVTITTTGVPVQIQPAGGTGYRIERLLFDMEGTPLDISTLRSGTRFVTVLRVTPVGEQAGRLMVSDPLPAGIEIDNPTLVRSADISKLSWLKSANVAHTEVRSDRFLAAVDHRGREGFDLAYVARAVSEGEFHHPAPSVEDMYRADLKARGITGRIVVRR